MTKVWKILIILPFILLGMLGCEKVKSSLTTSDTITGLNNSATYSYKEASSGAKYEFKSNGRKFNIFLDSSMVGFSFYAVDESGNKDYLDLTGILDEPADELANKKYRVEVGQHDFDFDGTDELVIATYEPENGIAFSIYKLKNNHWLKIHQNPEIKVLVWEPNAEIKGNTIKIDRHLRGFWDVWALESGVFAGALDVDKNYSSSNR